MRSRIVGTILVLAVVLIVIGLMRFNLAARRQPTSSRQAERWRDPVDRN